MAYAKPDPVNPTAPWIVHKISERIGVGAHGMGVGDINGDGRMDVVNARGWWEQPPARSTQETTQEAWTFHAASFGSGGADIITSTNRGTFIFWNKMLPARKPSGKK